MNNIITGELLDQLSDYHLFEDSVEQRVTSKRLFDGSVVNTVILVQGLSIARPPLESLVNRRGAFCAGYVVCEPSRDVQQAGTDNSRSRWRVSIIIFTLHAQKEGRM